MVNLIFNSTTGTLYGQQSAPFVVFTAVYTQVIQSAMKTFLSGAIATANVTGGYSEAQMRSSWSHWWQLSLGRDGMDLLLRWPIYWCAAEVCGNNAIQGGYGGKDGIEIGFEW